MNDLIHLGAGPSFIPEEVKQNVTKEIENFNDSGLSALEVSHRSKEFERVNSESEEGLRELLGIPSNFFVIFLQGGATFQNASIPMNLSSDGEKLGYIVTGEWSNKTYLDGSKLRESTILYDGQESGFNTIPSNNLLDGEEECSLTFLTSNETINGVQIKEYNNIGKSLVIDMSSDIASRKIDWFNCHYHRWWGCCI